MFPRKMSSLLIAPLFSPKLAKASAALVAVVTTAGCGTTTTGVTQLPVPPNREQTAFTAAPPSNGPPTVATNECKQGRGNYRLGAGDKIRVVVLQDSEFSGDYEVNATGAISVRVLGPIQVVGMTLLELEDMLRERYRQGGYLVTPRLSVELVASRPFYIVGEVSRPGQFPYVYCLHVIQAIAIAGGFTRRASKSSVTIKRFYATTAEEQAVTEDTLVEPGDVLRVPERYF
jgi:protein involved in polysaccharide export with SLBB domain